MCLSRQIFHSNAKSADITKMRPRKSLKARPTSCAPRSAAEAARLGAAHHGWAAPRRFCVFRPPKCPFYTKISPFQTAISRHTATIIMLSPSPVPRPDPAYRTQSQAVPRKTVAKGHFVFSCFSAASPLLKHLRPTHKYALSADAALRSCCVTLALNQGRRPQLAAPPATRSAAALAAAAPTQAQRSPRLRRADPPRSCACTRQ